VSAITVTLKKNATMPCTVTVRRIRFELTSTSETDVAVPMAKARSTKSQ
jgi:hypothetical protein